MLCATPALSLDEYFNLYDSPQGLAMGNAFTADAEGHAANYYNPAGLAKANKRRTETILFAFDGIPSFSGLSTAVEARTFGMYHLLDEVQSNPTRYHYNRFNVLPGYSRRGFAAAILGTYEFAARSDGNDVDINSHVDVIPTIGFGTNLAGNVLKLGVTLKAVMRNELKGVYAHSQISGGEAQIAPQMAEGLGFGGDIGMMMTLPNRYLPTLGVVWKDVLNTRFSHSNILNKRASGTPSPIEQSVNAAFSIHPIIGRGLRGTISVEVKHIEQTEVALRKRLHLGFELAGYRSLFFWGGLNQLYLTAGVGLRVPGGNLEVGTYSQEVGEGDAYEESRRLFFRYTLSF